MKIFTIEELKQYDGSQKGMPVYFTYKGRVYDVSEHPLFVDGIHFEHYAGADLTSYMIDAPHGEEVLEKMRVVGEIKI
ncbi:MAG: cytochrome b5 [Deltaproteobacteria bacterium]|nr:cytochrome b5 [Deltaproteobacteria bacterium]